MKISFDKYEGIVELVDLIDDTEESVQNFIDKFTRYTGIKNIMLAEDDVFEIENLDFNEIDDLISYFTISEIIDKRYYTELLQLAEMVDTREEFCKKATNITDVEVKQYGIVVRLNNIDFEKKADLIEYLKAYEVFDRLADMAWEYTVSEDGRGISLDGMSFVHDCKQSMLDNPQHDFPIEGYLKNGKVEWKRVDKSAYNEHKTSQGNVSMLKLLDEANIKSIYIVKPKEYGIVEKPYPVAILPNKKYVYIYKSKDD